MKITNSNISGNIIYKLELNETGSLTPIKPIHLIYSDSSVKELLAAEKIYVVDIFTEGRNYILIREGEKEKECPCVLLMKCIKNGEDDYTLIDIGDPDKKLFPFIIEEFLKKESRYGCEDWEGKTKPMKLAFDNGDILFELAVKDWYFSIWNDYVAAGYPWCKVDLRIKTKYLDFETRDDELLERAEVDDIKDALKSILDRTMESEEHMTFSEPDIELYFDPECTKYNDDKHWYRDGQWTFPPTLKMKIVFWSIYGGPDAGAFEYTFDEGEIDMLCTYFRYVTQEIGEDDPGMKALIEKGIVSELESK